LLKGVASEIVKLSQKKEIPMDENKAIRFLEQVGEEARLHVPSMLVDVNRKQKTEIECLNGAVIREAEKFGIEVPYNRAVCAIVRTLENTYEKVID
jgi:2-dehydropantoate 2-reductase